jgi:hypothetical protein
MFASVMLVRCISLDKDIDKDIQRVVVVPEATTACSYDCCVTWCAPLPYRSHLVCVWRARDHQKSASSALLRQLRNEGRRSSVVGAAAAAASSSPLRPAVACCHQRARPFHDALAQCLRPSLSIRPACRTVHSCLSPPRAATSASSQSRARRATTGVTTAAAAAAPCILRRLQRRLPTGSSLWDCACCTHTVHELRCPHRTQTVRVKLRALWPHG